VPSAVAAGVNVGVGQSVPVTIGVTINVNQTGSLSDTLPNGFTYSFGGTVEQPQIFSLSPTTGSNDGGTRVTIVGTGFSSPVQVFFEGGSPKVSIEASVVSVTPTQIVILSPPARGFGNALANNPVDVRVKNLNSGFETTATGGFHYGSKSLITSFAPGQLEYNDVTTIITIQGQGFEAPVAASIANVAARVVGVSGTEVQVQSPGVVPTGCQDVSGPVTTVNINTGDGATSTATFIYRVPKTAVTGISPTSGPQGGGTSVTLSGSGLDGPVRVQFGDQAVTSLPGPVPGTVVAVTPAFGGTFPTVTCTVGGVAGTMNVDATVNVQVTNLATTCTDTLAKAFTYHPADTTCKATPPPPVLPVASFTFAKAGLTVTFADTSSGNPTTFSWIFGDGSAITAVNAQENPTHTYAAPGNYVVKLTVTNGSGSSSTNQLITVP
jgi:plastocyanin